jgi:hypothetical protein
LLEGWRPFAILRKPIYHAKRLINHTINLIQRRIQIASAGKVFYWKPNNRWIEIEITTRCPLACFNCDRSVRQAPTNYDMSLEQIRRFVDESKKLNWKWSHIRLMGGEAVLHPNFFEIHRIIDNYRDFNPRCIIEVLSSGYGDEVKNILSELPKSIYVMNSNKNSNINKFSSYNIAPIDLQNYQYSDFSRGCWITHKAGLGLSRYGYYPCGAGASVDRVFGFDIGLKNLSSVNYKTLRNQLRILCSYCGHYKENFSMDVISEEKMSDRWKKAYEEYKIAEPQLSVY